MNLRYRDSILVLVMAALVVGLFYVVSWNQSRVDDQAVALSPESERLREELVKLSGDLDASSLEGRACRASLAGFLYELRKDSVSRTAALGAERTWQIHARVTFMAALVLAVAGLILAIAIFLAAGRENADSQRPTYRSGVAALGASVLALAVLALILGVDGRGKTTTGGAALSLDLAAFVERCEDYRRSEG